MPITAGALGRLAHDEAALAALPLHFLGRDTLLSPAAVAARGKLKWTPSLVKNDVWGTCTVAGLINSARYWSLLHGFDLVNDEADELNLFATLGGVSPTDDAAMAGVPGLVMLQVLQYVETRGFDVGGQTALVPEFAVVQTPGPQKLADVLEAAGSVYTGIRLYEADMQPGAVWQGSPAKAGRVVGGHCLLPINLASDTFDLVTWGGTVQADSEWLISRIDEAYRLRWTFPVTT